MGIVYIFLWHFVVVKLPQEGYFDLALRAAKWQILDKANEYFHKTLIYDPKQPKAYLGLGRIRFDQQNYKEALYYLDKAHLYNLNPKTQTPKDISLACEIKKLKLECKRRNDPQ